MTTRDQALTELARVLDAEFLHALAEPARVRIVQSLIAEGAQDVGQLAEPLPQERSVVSRHVKVLEQAGLVRIEREGRRRVVHLLADVCIERLEQMLDTIKECVAICCPPACRGA